MNGDENPIHIWHNVQKHLSFRIVRSTIIGAVVGSLSLTLMYFLQVVSHSNEEHRSIWIILLGTAFGALVGYLGSKHRKRNCPNCGLSMGATQNIRSGGYERASLVNQLDLRKWTTNKGVHLEYFYLCRHCDLEFRLTNLEEREATHKEGNVTGSQIAFDPSLAQRSTPSSSVESKLYSFPTEAVLSMNAKDNPFNSVKPVKKIHLLHGLSMSLVLYEMASFFFALWLVLSILVTVYGHEKSTIDGVTTVALRLKDIYFALFAATAVYFIFISIEYLTKQRKRYLNFRSVITGFGFIAFVMFLTVLFSEGFSYRLRLDSDRMTVDTLLGTPNEIIFDRVQTVTFEEQSHKDKKGKASFSFLAQVTMKSGELKKVSNLIFVAEDELRDVLQRREIRFIDNAPSRVRARASAVPQASKPSEAAAQERYELSIINAAHPTLAGSEWMWVNNHIYGKDKDWGHRLRFGTDNSVTIIYSREFISIQHVATFERTGEKYLFHFADHSTMEATLKLRGPESLGIRNCVADGGTATEVGSWFSTASAYKPVLNLP